MRTNEQHGQQQAYVGAQINITQITQLIARERTAHYFNGTISNLMDVSQEGK